MVVGKLWNPLRITYFGLRFDADGGLGQLFEAKIPVACLEAFRIRG